MRVSDLKTAELERYLKDEKHILAVYLFGSHSEGVAHIRSDVDLAILLSPSVDSARYTEYRLRYLAELKEFVTGTLDLVVLNQVPPLLQFQILQKGKLIFDRDSDARAEIEMNMLGQCYLAARFYKFQFSYLIQRIKEEGLGRGSQSHRSAIEEIGSLSFRVGSDL